jgi:phage shock protein C
MTAYATTHERRFVRDGDRALIGGVCAGIADYFGFRLCAVRAIFLIAFFVAFPVTVLTYLAIVFLVPAETSRYEYVVERKVRRRRMSRREKREARREAEVEEQDRAAERVRERYRSLDERLARIEQYVTSSRYNLDREFRNL